MEKRYVKIFIAVQALLYAAFLWLDMSGAGGSRWIKYASVVLCLGFSALLSARGGEGLVTAAMGFTLAADTFLLILDTAYAAGVALFCAVQALYFVRIYRANGRRAALPARLALLLAAVAALWMPDMLSPLNIEARYPLHKSRLLESLTVERCEKMIQETEALFLWIRKKC